MSAPNFFIGNNWLTFWDSEIENFPNVRIDGTPLRQYDTMIDVRTGTVRQYGSYNPPGFTGWQPTGVLGTSNGDPINFGSEVEFTIIDQEGTATAYPTLSFGCLDGALTTPVKKFTIVMNNDALYFKQGDVTGSNIMTFDPSGNVKIWNNLEVVGDIVLDDITTDVITLKDRIQHDGNITNFIAFETDKMTLDSSGTSIVLDDAAMADKVTITGATKFINEINAVPDIYLANHIHHLADVNTRVGFPANDQIGLRTGGTDRILITDTRTTIGPELAIADGAPRILGNMSGSPSSSRLAIQNSTLNGNSRFYVIPNGTGNISAINFRNDSAFDDTLPFQAVDLGIVAGESRLTASGSNGSPAPDITFRNNAVEIYRQSATQTTHKATSTNTTTEKLFRVIDQNDIPLFYVDGRGGVTSSTTGTALGSFNTIRCDSGTSDAYFRLARGNTDKWLFRNVSATDQFMLSPDNTDTKALHMDQSGNVMIGQSTASYKFVVNSGTASGNSRFISETNSGCDVGWITGTGAAANTKFSILASPSPLGNGYGQVSLRTRVADTFPTALLLDGSSDATFGNDIFMGGAASITKTNSNGSINIIGVNAAKKVFANISPPNPYTGTIRVLITWSTWGGNNTGCLINLTANARIYSGNFGYANGFITASQSTGGTTFTSFSTANLVQSNITTTVTAPGNYQLQIDLDPTGNCDRFNLEMTIPEGGTGSVITAVQISIV